MVELLAPVGSQEALIAAVESGADAVYLGGKAFGARAYAPNFGGEELAAAVKYAHLRGVLVYVTVNTLVDNSELAELAAYVRHLYHIGVDAVIVQDLGVARIIQEVAPGLPLHASTQMTVHNLEGVRFLAANGFTRVVLARELSLAEIQAICRQSSLEIEVFVHGALCVCYSGQCLMSSMIGGRSGNRGRCAQPCRLPYTLIDQQGQNVLQQADAGEYLLSPKDLNTLDVLPELIQAGVGSFKIEGRMKRPEYVAVVVDTYRRAVDRLTAGEQEYIVDEADQKDLAQIFNRDFTTAYLYGKQGRKMMSDRRPNNRGVRIGRVIQYNPGRKTAVIKLDETLNQGDMIEFWVKVGGRVTAHVSQMSADGCPVQGASPGMAVEVAVTAPVKVNDRVFKTFDAKLMTRARSFFSGAQTVHPLPVTATVEVAPGKPLSILLQDKDGFSGRAETGFIAEKALKRPLTREAIAKQIERLGTTIFVLQELGCHIEGEVMVPLSEINDARRRAVEELERARLQRFERPPLPETSRVFLPAANQRKKKDDGGRTELVVNVDHRDKVKAALENGADIIMFGGESFNHKPFLAEDYQAVLAMVRKHDKKIRFSTPRIVKEGQKSGLLADLALFNQLQPDAVSVGNLGTLQMVKEHCSLPLHGDYPLNIYNAVTVEFFRHQGLSSLTASPELNLAQVEQLLIPYHAVLECLVHGYLTLMISEYCAIGSFLGGLHTGRCTTPCLKGPYWLKDRKEEVFPVVTDQYCRMHILNAKELSMLAHLPRLMQMGVERVRIEGKKSTPQQVAKVTRLYKEVLEQGEEHPLFRQDKLDTVEPGNITRGHYFRGVL
ncbi:DUF3656 domain-containing U32 family peptidase [Lucifera butyrica]|uniref:DUF3656 domain-containing U32 family peptidase n=1 Tax=Lucifera butyrica TaxID=1351585 RepID=UPI000F03D207|nr:DUF3656 domain-containing protein [Lucifera butyrica]